MHNKIIQVEEAPTLKMFWKDAKYYSKDGWLMYTIANYVRPDEDRLYTIKLLEIGMKDSMKDKVKFFKDDDDEVHGTGFIFSEGFREAYFAERYEDFKKELAELTERATFERFCTFGMGGWMQSLNELYDYEHGIYIDAPGLGLQTLDGFIRDAEANKPYYICATVDYHA